MGAADEVLHKAERLRQEAVPFAMALVVRCESPTSAKPGARGLIARDGTITGWIGGGCAQPIVIEESLRAIREGSPRLLRIMPEAGSVEVAGMRTYEMVCYSGGTLDIFIEPVLPPPQIVILGRSPVARTLARLAKPLRYEVIVQAPLATKDDFPDADRLQLAVDLSGIRAAQAYVVVSTQGEDDESAMEAAVRCDAAYVAFVASKKKWDTIAKGLAARGIAGERIARVKAPAGVEIQAVEPEEIALSVLAQIVSARRTHLQSAQEAMDKSGHSHTGSSAKSAQTASSTEAVDPICHMTVDPRTAKHVSSFGGKSFYFCCAGCKQKFDKDPTQYAAG